MIRTLGILGFLLCLTGCAGTYQWEHPQGLGPAALERDRHFCEELVREEGRGLYHGRSGFGLYWGPGYNRHGRYASPYYAYRGYPYRSYSYTQHRRDLKEFCLKSRGWRQVERR